MVKLELFYELLPNISLIFQAFFGVILFFVT